MRPLLEDRGRITESIRILVPVDRMKQKCLEIMTKRVRRSQQFHLCAEQIDQINRSGILELYNVVSVKQIQMTLE